MTKTRLFWLLSCAFILVAFRPLSQDIPPRPTIRLDANNGQIATEAIFSYCWPVSAGNNQCDFAPTQNFQTPLNVEQGQTLTLIIDNSPSDPSSLTVSITSANGDVQAFNLQPLTQAFLDEELALGENIIQIDATYANVGGVEAYVTFIFQVNVQAGLPPTADPGQGGGISPDATQEVAMLVTEEAEVILPTEEAEVILPTEEAEVILPTEEAEVILPTEEAEVILPTEEAEVILPTEEAEVILPTEEAEVILPTEEAEVILPTEEAEVILPTEEAEVILPTEEAEVILPTEEAEVILPTEEATPIPSATVAPTEEEATATPPPTEAFTATPTSSASETATLETATLAATSAGRPTSTTVPRVPDSNFVPSPVPGTPTQTPLPPLPSPDPIEQPSTAPAAQLVFAGRSYAPSGQSFCFVNDNRQRVCVENPLEGGGQDIRLLQGFSTQFQLVDSPRPAEVELSFLNTSTFSPIQSQTRQGDKLILLNVDVPPNTYILRVSINWGTSKAQYFFRVRVN